MFRLMRLRPPHGWPSVWWELTIVTVGILIALIAQELVQAAHWNGEVRAFQRSVASEVGMNLGTYAYRTGQNACTDRRIKELESWWQSWRKGHPVELTGRIGHPASLSLRTSVWTSRTPELTSHLSSKQRLLYAQLYDELENNDTHRLLERTAWLALGDYDGARSLDQTDLKRIRGLLNQVRLRQEWFVGNSLRIRKFAEILQISEGRDPSWPATDSAMCRSILNGRARHE
jgi:hypothetical protein